MEPTEVNAKRLARLSGGPISLDKSRKPGTVGVRANTHELDARVYMPYSCT
jgi:hypothetical protein